MLTDRVVLRASKKPAPYRLGDTRGLYLIVRPDGAKWWRVDYRFQGRRGTLSAGVYPDVSLAQAREKRDTIRQLIAAGQDPSHHRRVEARKSRQANAQTFEAIARQWLDRQRSSFAPATTKRVSYLIDRYAVPALGRRPVSSIVPADVLDMLTPIESRGRHETAHRTKQVCGQIFRYAVALGLLERDPTPDLRGALMPVPTEHHPSLTTPEAIGGLLRAIDGLQASASVLLALKMAPYVFVRPGELRKAEWAEVDLSDGVWRIPAAKMKMRQAHVVPLARQVVALLTEAARYNRGKYVFRALRGDRPLSDMALNAALRRLGYGTDEMTTHGFRSMASTRLNEMGVDPDLIELQLAHRERNSARAAYNRATRLPERREMMQAWADELDRLRGPARES